MSLKLKSSVSLIAMQVVLGFYTAEAMESPRTSSPPDSPRSPRVRNSLEAFASPPALLKKQYQTPTVTTAITPVSPQLRFIEYSPSTDFSRPPIPLREIVANQTPVTIIPSKLAKPETVANKIQSPLKEIAANTPPIPPLRPANLGIFANNIQNPLKENIPTGLPTVLPPIPPFKPANLGTTLIPPLKLPELETSLSNIPELPYHRKMSREELQKRRATMSPTSSLPHPPPGWVPLDTIRSNRKLLFNDSPPPSPPTEAKKIDDWEWKSFPTKTVVQSAHSLTDYPVPSGEVPLQLTGIITPFTAASPLLHPEVEELKTLPLGVYKARSDNISKFEKNSKKKKEKEPYNRSLSEKEIKNKKKLENQSTLFNRSFSASEANSKLKEEDSNRPSMPKAKDTATFYDRSKLPSEVLEKITELQRKYPGQKISLEVAYDHHALEIIKKTGEDISDEDLNLAKLWRWTHSQQPNWKYVSSQEQLDEMRPLLSITKEQFKAAVKLTRADYKKKILLNAIESETRTYLQMVTYYQVMQKNAPKIQKSPGRKKPATLPFSSKADPKNIAKLGQDIKRRSASFLKPDGTISDNKAKREELKNKRQTISFGNLFKNTPSLISPRGSLEVNQSNSDMPLSKNIQMQIDSLMSKEKSLEDIKNKTDALGGKMPSLPELSENIQTQPTALSSLKNPLLDIKSDIDALNEKTDSLLELGENILPKLPSLIISNVPSLDTNKIDELSEQSTSLLSPRSPRTDNQSNIDPLKGKSTSLLDLGKNLLPRPPSLVIPVDIKSTVALKGKMTSLSALGKNLLEKPAPLLSTSNPLVDKSKTDALKEKTLNKIQAIRPPWALFDKNASDTEEETEVPLIDKRRPLPSLPKLSETEPTKK